jgi:hypothetical protein
MMRWLFGRRVTPGERQEARDYLAETSEILARHAAAADRWDALVQDAIEKAPHIPVAVNPSEELLAGAHRVHQEALELLVAARAVSAPALAAEAHRSFVGMFDEWRTWSDVTLRVIESDEPAEAHLREMFALQETNAAATRGHAYWAQRLAKDVGISPAEVERMMVEAMRRVD